MAIGVRQDVPGSDGTRPMRHRAAGVRFSDIGSATENRTHPQRLSRADQTAPSGIQADATELICSSARLRQLNDALRTTLRGGKIEMTAGVRALPRRFRARALSAMRAYDDFTDESDPFHEHELGTFELDGHRFCWRIEAFDKSLRYGSDDPNDPDKTCRVLTLMLACEL